MSHAYTSLQDCGVVLLLQVRSSRIESGEDIQQIGKFKLSSPNDALIFDRLRYFKEAGSHPTEFLDLVCSQNL